MKKSNTIFGISTNDVVDQIENDSKKTCSNVEVPKQKTKTLVEKHKVMGHNTKNK